MLVKTLPLVPCVRLIAVGSTMDRVQKRFFLLFFVLLPLISSGLLSGCSTGQRFSATKTILSLPLEIHTVTSRGITAHFGGEKPPSDSPLEFGVSALWFTFPGDKTVYEFKPVGELFFSDWTFDIFSRNDVYVLLLQDHYGPYHIVATDQLKDYLLGCAKSAKVVSAQDYPPHAMDPPKVHKFVRWTSDRAFEFSGSCCGWERLYFYDITAGKLQFLHEKKIVDRQG